jgi:hypothetical protein
VELSAALAVDATAGRGQPVAAVRGSGDADVAIAGRQGRRAGVDGEASSVEPIRVGRGGHRDGDEEGQEKGEEEGDAPPARCHAGTVAVR